MLIFARSFSLTLSLPFTPQLPSTAVQTLCCTLAAAGSSAILQLAAAAGPKGCYNGGTRGGYCTAPYTVCLSGAPECPYIAACLSSPPIQALKCLVKFTEAHHLLDWRGGGRPMSKFSLSHLVKSLGGHKERVQRKQRA